MATRVLLLQQRAAQAEQLINEVTRQIRILQPASSTNRLSQAEQDLRSENAILKVKVEQLKARLIQAEIRNGITQVPLPIKTMATPQSQPTPAPEPSLPVKKASPPVETEKQEKQEKPAEKKKGDKKPATAGGKGGAKTVPAEGAVNDTVDAGRLDLRVGKIVDVDKHPDADSLYVETVDVGEASTRTIVSGLVKHVPIEEMRGRLAVFLCNLKPAKMRGVLSEGMIMCASAPDKIEIIEVPQGAKPGDRLSVEGYQANADQPFMNPKKKIWEQVKPDLRINTDGLASYKGALWVLQGLGPFKAPSLKDVQIS